MGKIGPIEDGIPVPTKVRADRASRYPWDILKVGQSFLVELEYPEGPEEIMRLKERVRSSTITRIKRTDKNEDYVVRIEYLDGVSSDGQKIPRGVRVWRTK